MKTKNLEHLRDLLCSEGELPAPSRMELLKLVEEAMRSANDAIFQRDEILRQNAEQTGRKSLWAQAEAISIEAKRYHKGRSSEYPWIASADRYRRVPESPRMLYDVLKLNLK